MVKNTPKILSCFVDETGDFGEFDSHCPYYMVSVVLHDQSDSIEAQLNGMEQYLSDLGYRDNPCHHK